MNLKNNFPSIPAMAILIAALAPAAPAVAREEVQADRHAHDDASVDMQLQLDNGEKWATDAPLRRGMENIRAALTTALPEFRDDSPDTGEPPAGDYQRLAEDVQREVRYIIDNCKLPPAADAQLHVLLAALIQGAAAMQDDRNPRQAAARIAQALNAYGKYFAHPGWGSLPADAGNGQHMH